MAAILTNNDSGVINSNAKNATITLRAARLEGKHIKMVNTAHIRQGNVHSMLCILGMEGWKPMGGHRQTHSPLFTI